jgi:hypothetical protein
MQQLGDDNAAEGWSELQVSQGEPLRAKRMWSCAQYVQASMRVPDAHRLCRMVDVLDSFLRAHGNSLKWRWTQPRFRLLLYHVQDTVRRLDMLVHNQMEICPTHKHDHTAMSCIMRELRTRYQGPHCADLPAYMHLKRRLSTDVALRIFEYL